jgi:hypothetical protein
MVEASGPLTPQAFFGISVRFRFVLAIDARWEE